MRCSFCSAILPANALSVLGFALCADCHARLLRQDPARREYDWFVAAVRRGLAEGLYARLQKEPSPFEREGSDRQFTAGLIRRQR